MPLRKKSTIHIDTLIKATRKARLTPADTVAVISAGGPGIMRSEIQTMGGRHATRPEIIESLKLVARGDLWPLVIGKSPFAEAEVVHQQLETGSVTGRAALLRS